MQTTTLEQRSYTHDPVLNILTQNSTREGGAHSYTYDGLDHLTQAIHPAATGLAQEDYSYDNVGNRENPVDLNQYDYDANHRISQNAPLTYNFDDDGNLISRSDGASFTHNKDNRLTQYNKGSTTASYQYDPFGRRISKTVDGTTTWFVWDGSQLLAEYDTNGVRQNHYSYLYDQPMAIGQTVEVPPPQPQEVIIDNDDPDTSSTGSWTSNTSNKAYNGSYRLSNNQGNTYRWTPAGLTNDTYDVYAWWPGVKQHNSAAQYTISHNGQTSNSTQDQSKTGNQWVLLGSYTFSGNGSEYIELSDNGGKTAADAIRLVKQLPPPPPPPLGQEVILDNGDPETSSTGTWTSTNSNKAYSGSYRLSDNNGNTYRWTPTGLNASTYEVYARWPGVKQHNSAAQYSIVHDGQTDTSTQDQSKTGNQWVLLGSYDFSGTGAEYIELSDSGGKTAADAVRLVEQTVAPPPEPTYEEAWYAIHNDYLGTPKFITDSSEQIVWEQSQSAFGQATVNEDPDGDTTTFTYNQRFPGQYFDEESNLHYNYFRDYDPTTGRYIQSDPIGLRGGLNTYAYVEGNPLIYKDYYGLKLQGKPKYPVEVLVDVVCYTIEIVIDNSELKRRGLKEKLDQALRNLRSDCDQKLRKCQELCLPEQRQSCTKRVSAECIRKEDDIYEDYLRKLQNLESEVVRILKEICTAASPL